MRVLAAGAAVAIALGSLSAGAQQDDVFATRSRPSVRFHLLPPYADPGFASGPVPPPDKSYLIPLGEVLFLTSALWAYDYVSGQPYSKISLQTIGQQFNKGWILDTDDFWANDMLHPIHGAMNYNAARSTGLGFYESFGYAFLGSFLWEQFAENLPPSINDQVYSPFGGSLVGEMLFRMSRLVLDSGGYAPSGLRQFFALVLSPIAGGNRLLFGDRYRGELLLPPSWMCELRVGSMVAGSKRSGAEAARDVGVGPWASLAADVTYGIPGTPDLSLKHPFDHFTLSTSVSLDGGGTVPTATLMIRGLLVGEPITLDGEAGGLWGLFTSYDFIAPSAFRIACFGLGPGISLMKSWSSFALHGTLFGQFMPWSEGGSFSGRSQDYRYGPGGDLVLELRAHFGDRVVARLEAREYLISGMYDRGDWEDVSLARAQVTVRLFGANALSGEVTWGHRQARYPLEPQVWQRVSTATLSYTILQGW